MQHKRHVRFFSNLENIMQISVSDGIQEFNPFGQVSLVECDLKQC